MPTMTVRLFQYDELKRALDPADRILIISCNACARQSDGLGGREGLQALAEKLSADGFKVHHQELLPVACSTRRLNDRLNDEDVRKHVMTADIIIPLACDAGYDRIKGELPGLRILRVARTLGKGSSSPDAGARLTEVAPGVDLEVPPSGGLPLADAAKQVGLYPGRF